MPNVVELLKSYLSNPTIKNILIAEDHLEYTPKEVLIDLLDEIERGLFICPKKIVLIFEHISIKNQEAINTAVNNKVFTEELKNIFLTCPFIEPKNLEINMFVELAKKAICGGIPILATENQATGYSSFILSTPIKRIHTANAAFLQAFDNEIFSQENTVAIFLGGAAHIVDLHANSQLKFDAGSIMGLKTALNDQGDTVSLFIHDEGGNFRFPNPTNEAPKIALKGYQGSENFDKCICVKPAKKLLSEIKEQAQGSMAAQVSAATPPSSPKLK